MRAFAVSLLLSAAGLLHAADPQLLRLVMPQPTVLAGVNVDQARATPFGAYIIDQMQANEQSLQQLDALTGFDPRRDVREILVASAAPPGTRGAGLVLVRGRFDVARIAAAAAQKGLPVTVYNGATVIQSRDNSIAFPDPTLAVAGPMAEVQEALDRRNAPASLPADVAVKVNQWSTTQDAWVVALVPPPVPPVPDPRLQEPVANVAAKIEQVSAGMKFGADVRITAEALATTEDDARSLAEVVRLLALLAQSSPTLGSTTGSLLQNLNVSTEARTLKLALSVPEDEFERIIKPQQRSRTASRK